MPARNSNADSCGWIELHLLWEVGHATAEIFQPLIANVVGNESMILTSMADIIKSILQYLKSMGLVVE